LALADEAKCTPAQAIYRIAQLRGIVPLAGSQNEEHMKQGVETDEVEFKGPSKKAVEEVNKFIDSESPPESAG